MSQPAESANETPTKDTNIEIDKINNAEVNIDTTDEVSTYHRVFHAEIFLYLKYSYTIDSQNTTCINTK